MTDRVIALIDMDCFYCQVESRLDPELVGKPVAVVQYKDWKGGGIIAVNYEARAFGVTRNMRGDQAKELCPEIVLCRVPEVRGKADLSKYRNAGREVIEVLLTFGATVERASVDEAYIDLTKLVGDRMADDDDNGGGVDPDKDLANTYVAKFPRQKLYDWVDGVGSDDEGRQADRRLILGASVVEEMRNAVYQKTQASSTHLIGAA